METMTDLKRKREDVDDGKPDEDEVAAGTTTDVAPAQVVLPPSSSSSSTSSCSPSAQSTPAPPPPAAPPEQCTSEEEGEIRPAPKSAPQTILICGKEAVLKTTGGRKRRKHPMETLVTMAYRARLAVTCKANDMVAALEIYREMKTKGVKQDLAVRFSDVWWPILMIGLVAQDFLLPAPLPCAGLCWRARVICRSSCRLRSRGSKMNGDSSW